MPEPIFQLYVKRDAESPAAPMAQPGAQRLEAGDTAADDRLDAQVESERAAEGPDMLDEEAPLE